MSGDPDPRQKHARLKGAARSYSRRAQSLPYHWDQLSPGEVAELRAKLADSSPSPSDSEREVRLAVSLLLATGRRFADLYDLKLYAGSPEDAEGRPGIFLQGGEERLVRLPAGFITRGPKTEVSDPADSSSLRKKATQQFLTPIGHPPSDWPSIESEPRQKFSKKSPKWHRRHLLDPSRGRDEPLEDNQAFERAIPDFVIPFLPAIGAKTSKRLFNIPSEELSGGIKEFLAGRRAEGYSSRRVAKGIRPLERQRWNELFLSPGGHDVDASRLTNSIPAPNFAAGYYGVSRPGPVGKSRRAFSPGSKFAVSDDLVRKVARKARDNATTRGGLGGFAALSDYSATMICFAIGHRASFSHLPSLAAIDSETGFCVVEDKDVDDPNSARLVWVCDAAREQILVYECELRARIDAGAFPQGEVLLRDLDDGKLVFPDPNGKPQKISKIVKRTFAKIKPARSNVGRHWLATIMQGECSTETINAFLGHWAEGASPWSHGSCLDPLAYRADLQRSLPKLLRQVGWIPTDPSPGTQRFRPRLSSTPLIQNTSVGGALASPFFKRVLSRDIDAVLNFPALSKAIEQSPPRDLEFEIGRILASAVVNGALLNPGFWQSFVDAIPRARREKGVRWLELRSADGSPPSIRWIGDRTTDLCIQRWFKLFAKARTPEATDATQALETFLRSEVGSRLSAQDFVQAATLRWRLKLPTILMDHALNETPCSSLYHIASYGRTPGRNRSRGTSPNESFASFRVEQMKMLKRKYQDYAYVFNDVSSIQRWGAASHQSRKRICARWLRETFIRRHGSIAKCLQTGVMGEQESLLVKWAIHRLGERRPHRSTLGYSTLTVESRFSILANIILPKLNSENISPEDVRDATSAAWKEITNPNNALTVWQAGRCFERFLRGARATAEVEGDAESASRHAVTSLPRIGSQNTSAPETEKKEPKRRPAKNVYANVLLETVYVDALSKLVPLERAAELQLITVLGYRAGLRLPEAAGLLISDFIDVDGAFELHLDHNHLRRLKTPDSRRILPMRILLKDLELAKLRHWLHVRRLHAEALGMVSAQLFGPITSQSMILLQYYKTTIEASLGSPRYPRRFEILRHSFASFLFANLLSPDLASQNGLPVDLRGNIFHVKRRTLVDHLVGAERLGKSSLHAVSQALGHTGIHRTLESYLHLLDVSLGMHVNRDYEFARTSERKAAPSEELREHYVAPLRAERELSQSKCSGESPKEQRDEDDALAEALKHQPWTHTPASLDWTLIWLSISKGPAAITNLLNAYGVSGDVALRWRTIAGEIIPNYFKHTRSAPDLAMPKGPHPLYRMNFLWLSSNEPSHAVKRAIARFVGNADRNNSGSRLEDILQVARLLKYFWQCSIHTSHVVYALGSETKSVPGRLQTQFQQVRVGWDEKGSYPRLAFERFGNGCESKSRPLEWSADLSRFHKEKPKRSVHRQFVYSQRFWILILACFFELRPLALDHANSKAVRARIRRVADRASRLSFTNTSR